MPASKYPMKTPISRKNLRSAKPQQMDFTPPPDFNDPRIAPGFQRKHWPLCDGSHGPAVGTTDLHQRRCLEFLALYYELNKLQAQLLASRAQNSPDGKSRSLLAAIASCTNDLEKLEDHYAPIGFYGEPEMRGIYYRNIVFVRPELPRLYAKPIESSSHFAIPGLESIPAEELRGPIKVTRYGSRKVDL